MAGAGFGVDRTPSGGAPAAGSVVSVLNTTTTALGSGLTYTGTGERAPSDGVTVSCKADNTGTLYFDFSNDNTNWDSFPTSGFVVASGVHEYHSARVNSRFFRVRMVNDTGAQSYMRLYTYYGTHTSPNAPVNQTVGLDVDATFVRSSIAQDEIRIGRRTGIVGWTKFGHRSGLLAASGEQTIWGGTGNFTPMTSADTFIITYDGTGGGSTDGAGTTGATELTFWYIDAAGLPAIATHTLGTDGADTTAFTGLGINRVAVSASGANDRNASAIVVTVTTGGAAQAYIDASDSVTNQAIFFVGSNHDGILKYLFVNAMKLSGSSPKVTIKAYVYSRLVATHYEIFRYDMDTATENHMDINEPIGFNLGPTDVLYFVADTNTNDLVVNVRFNLNQYQRT